MASQHPDHASKPYWHDRAFISTQYETFECFLNFSELGISEYKWDWEGKLVDESVMERLLSEYFDYFKKHQLGSEKFLTFRLPNPKVEHEFRIGRAFMGLLSAASLAKQAGLQSPPLFEVILPMTETAEEMIDIQEAFKELVSLKHRLYRLDNNLLQHLEVIPLFEQVDTIMNSDKILDTYFAMHQKKFGFKPLYLRPYVARSDPALNSGLVPTVIAIKIALSHYADYQDRTGIELYPIIGSASLPFRGGLTPETVSQFAKEYQGVRTALIQSAFRYDYEIETVKKALKKLEKLLPQQKAVRIPASEEQELRSFIELFEKPYRQGIEKIASEINAVASQLPKRRERVQHIGLFGYSRGVGKVKLPRAIGFTAALYSLGIPPELIGTGRGLHAAQKLGKLPLIEKYYLNLRNDLERAGRFVQKDVLTKKAKNSPVWNDLLQDVTYVESFLRHELGPQSSDEKEHHKYVKALRTKLDSKEPTQKIIEKAAVLRKSLG